MLPRDGCGTAPSLPHAWLLGKGQAAVRQGDSGVSQIRQNGAATCACPSSRAAAPNSTQSNITPRQGQQRREVANPQGRGRKGVRNTQEAEKLQI